MDSLIRHKGYRIKDELIELFESRYGFVFPETLRKFYLSNNEATIRSVCFTVDEAEYNVARFIYPFVEEDKAVSVGLLLEMEKERKWFGENRIPFASDWGDDIYCWDTKTGEIFLYYPDEDEPEYITDSVGHFFDLLKQ